MAGHGDCGLRLFIFRRDRSAEHRSDSQRVEVITAYQEDASGPHRAVDLRRQSLVAQSHRVGEDSVRLQGLELGVAEATSCEPDEILRLDDAREGSHHHGVDQTEYRSIGADAESQR